MANLVGCDLTQVLLVAQVSTENEGDGRLDWTTRREIDGRDAPDAIADSDIPGESADYHLNISS